MLGARKNFPLHICVKDWVYCLQEHPGASAGELMGLTKAPEAEMPQSACGAPWLKWGQCSGWWRGATSVDLGGGPSAPLLLDLLPTMHR